MISPTLRTIFLPTLLVFVAGAFGARLLAGAPTTADPDTLATQARTLKEFRDCRGALRVATALLQKHPESQAARKIDRLIDVCLADLTQKELETLADRCPAPRVAAKAMLQMATRRQDGHDCAAAIAIYDRLASRYPDTTEAWRGSSRKAVNCLDPMGRYQDALSTLESVVQKAGRSPEGANALYWLGQLHLRDEEREEARAAFERLIRDYPIDLEYPSPPGLKIVQSARLDLKLLDLYDMSPTLDGIVSRVKRATGLNRTEYGTWREWMSSSIANLVQFGARMAALLLVLSCLGLARLAGLRPASSHVRILGKSWSLPRASLIVVAFCATELLYHLFHDFVSTFDVPKSLETLVWTHGERFETLAMAGVALGACLWKEPLRRIFAVNRRSLLWVAGGLVLTIVSGLAAFAIGLLIRKASGRAVEPVVSHGLASADLSTVRAAVVTIALTVLAAAGEECLFRGVVYEAFSGVSGRWVAAVLSSILFAAVHVVPLAYFTTVTLTGLVLIVVRDLTGGLFAPVVLHSLVNLLFYLARAHPS